VVTLNDNERMSEITGDDNGDCSNEHNGSDVKAFGSHCCDEE
jgi:hypothetical protein